LTHCGISAKRHHSLFTIKGTYMKTWIMVATAFFSSVVCAGASASPQTFKLYDSPQASVSPLCDQHILARLNSAKNTLSLQNALDGTCELEIWPEMRTYKLVSQREDGCGSMVYEGIRETQGSTGTIALIDNRARHCDDVIPALTEVTETTRSGTWKYYSAK
jgi:hypothetical protein